MKEKSCFNEFVKYVTLNILGMIGLSCYILADTFFVSWKLGADGLAALNLAIPVYSFNHGTGLMLGMGGATRYTIARNQKRFREANEIFTRTILIAICFMLLFAGIGLWGSDTLASILGAEGEIHTMTETYLKVLLLYSPAFIFNDIFLAFVRNDGEPQLAMTGMLVGNFSNVILDYIFMLRFHMGIFGAVLATGMAAVISLCVLSIHFIRKKNQFHFVKVLLRVRPCFRILVTGVPSLVTELSSGIVMIVFNSIILSLQGNPGVAAYGVIANILLVIVGIYTGISQGIQPLLSKYFGRGEKEKIQKIFQYAMTTVAGLSILIYTGLFMGADGIVGLFNSEGNALMQKIAVDGMKLYFLACIFAGWNIVFTTYFASTDRIKPANVISILRGFVLIIPVTFLMAFLGNMTGLWLAFPVTEVLVFILGVTVYFWGKEHSINNGRNAKAK